MHYEVSLIFDIVKPALAIVANLILFAAVIDAAAKIFPGRSAWCF